MTEKRQMQEQRPPTRGERPFETEKRTGSHFEQTIERPGNTGIPYQQAKGTFEPSTQQSGGHYEQPNERRAAERSGSSFEQPTERKVVKR